MAAYLVVQVVITDPDRWRAYREGVVPLITAFGGRRLAGGGSETLEGGDEAGRATVFEFPSMDAIHAFWASPEYMPVKALRQGAATLSAWAVPGG